MGKNCKKFKKAVNVNDTSYSCVSSNCNMQLRPKCTVLLPAAFTGIKERGMNAMLFCNNCVKQNE